MGGGRGRPRREWLGLGPWAAAASWAQSAGPCFSAAGSHKVGAAAHHAAMLLAVARVQGQPCSVRRNQRLRARQPGGCHKRERRRLARDAACRPRQHERALHRLRPKLSTKRCLHTAVQLPLLWYDRHPADARTPAAAGWVATAGHASAVQHTPLRQHCAVLAAWATGASQMEWARQGLQRMPMLACAVFPQGQAVSMRRAVRVQPRSPSSLHVGGLGVLDYTVNMLCWADECFRSPNERSGDQQLNDVSRKRRASQQNTRNSSTAHFLNCFLSDCRHAESNRHARGRQAACAGGAAGEHRLVGRQGRAGGR